jgi:hypothetical protein
LGKAPLVAEEVDSRQPVMFKSRPLTFLISMNSALGRPTCGEGSAMISPITASKRATVCATTKAKKQQQFGLAHYN